MVYHDDYNIGFFGLERFHVFDSRKWGRVLNLLQQNGVATKVETILPKPPSREMLLDVHTEQYVHALETSPLKCAMVLELAPVAIIPNFIVQRKVM